MPPVTTPIEREPTEETENAALNGFPPHLPGFAMTGVLGQVGHLNLTSADIFKDFKVNTLVGELVAGLQDWVMGGHDDPDSPKTEEGKRKQAQAAAQEMADAFQSYGDSPWEQQWMADTHTIAGTTMTGANFIRLGKSMHDKNFRALLQQRLEAKGLSETEAEKAMNDGSRLIYLKSKESKTQNDLHEMKRLEADPKAGLAIQEGGDLRRTLDAESGPQGPIRTGGSLEGTMDEAANIRSLSADFAVANVHKPIEGTVAHQTNIVSAVETKTETHPPKQDVEDTAALKSARQTQTIGMGLG